MIAVIGPRSSSGSKHTHPLCAGLQIPQITPDATDSTLSYTLGDYHYLVKVKEAMSNRTKEVHKQANLTREYSCARPRPICLKTAH